MPEETQNTLPEPETPEGWQTAVDYAFKRASDLIDNKGSKFLYDPIVRRYVKLIKQSNWLDNLRGTLMVVAIVTASMSYQATLSLPDPIHSKTGFFILFILFNSLSFASSLAVIAANIMYETETDTPNSDQDKPSQQTHQRDQQTDQNPSPAENPSSLHGNVSHQNVNPPRKFNRVKKMVFLLLLAILTILVAYIIALLGWLL